MTTKISNHKISRIMTLYFGGHGQAEIGQKLGINQSTVSDYVNHYKAPLGDAEFKMFPQEMGIMDTLQSLHILAGELKKTKLTVEESKAGLSILVLLNKYGIQEKDYGAAIETYGQLHDKGFLQDAIKLNELQKTTGLSFKEIISKYENTSEKLEEAQAALHKLKTESETMKTAVVDLGKKKNEAGKELQFSLDKAGVDMKRLQSVETLAKALNKAHVGDDDLENYIKRQDELGKAGISLDMLAMILDKAKVLTAPDQGEGLYNMLSEYGDLAGAIKEAGQLAAKLEYQANILEEKNKLRKDLDSSIAKLTIQKDGFEKDVAGFADQKNILKGMQKEVKSLEDTRATLKQDISTKEENESILSGGIGVLEKKLSDLKEKESKYGSLADESSRMAAEIARHKCQLRVLESFLGFLEPSSLAQIEGFISQLPALVSWAREQQYSPDFLRNYILNNLTGDRLRAFKCPSCHSRFTVDAAVRPLSVYHCPTCVSILVEVDQSGASTINTALAAVKQNIAIAKAKPVFDPGAVIHLKIA